MCTLDFLESGAANKSKKEICIDIIPFKAEHESMDKRNEECDNIHLVYSGGTIVSLETNVATGNVKILATFSRIFGSGFSDTFSINRLATACKFEFIGWLQRKLALVQYELILKVSGGRRSKMFSAPKRVTYKYSFYSKRFFVAQ